MIQRPQALAQGNVHAHQYSLTQPFVGSIGPADILKHLQLGIRVENFQFRVIEAYLEN